MSGNYKSGFRRYKRNLRWKAGQRKKGLSDKTANDGYNGWSNWDTWHTGLLMDNDEPTYRGSRQLMESGATPEQLRDWATQHVIGPHNQRQIKDAQEWNAIPREEREQRKRQHDIDQYGEDVVGFGNDLLGAGGFDPYHEEEVETPDLMMDPEMVNWPEIHSNILSEYPDDHPIHQLQQPTTVPEEWQ